MSGIEVSFDDYDAECIGFLMDHFDLEGEYVDIDAFPRYQELGHERVMKTIERFRRFQMVKFQTRGSIQILPQLFSVAEQLSVKDVSVYDIFLSYASSDSDLANELRDEIQEHGLKVFMAEKDIPVASQWKHTIREALRSSSRVLLLLTPKSIDRPWVLLETGAAWALNKTLIPAIAYVDPSQLVDPVRDIQARKVETTQQRIAFVDEIIAHQTK